MKSINYLIIILGTLLLSWVLPTFYHLVTDKATQNVFTYYSSVEKSFCSIDFDEQEDRLIRKNIKTNREYTEQEFDSILPLFYYRQLLTDGRMPDSIHGVPISHKDIGNKSFFFRINPTDKNKPHIPLYTLFESMSGRVKLEMPGDVFRLDHKMEFVSPETNRVNKEKSILFHKEFVKRGFKFPAKQVVGNPTVRKPYDEGYFIIDNANQIFHLKMVNGMPFLKKLMIPEGVNPLYITTMEPTDRSFYAFVYAENERLYIITTNKYAFQEIPCPKYNADQDRLVLMANPLYWNVNVISAKGKSVMAIHANTKEKVDEITFQNKSETRSFIRYILPFSISFTTSDSLFVKPEIYIGSFMAFVMNAGFLFLFFVVSKIKNRRQQVIPLVWIAITGIYGFISIIVFNRMEQA